MTDASGSVAAHLILGPREEPFLGAMLDSIDGAAELLIVNDNAPDPSPHAQTLQRSPFGRSGRLVVDRMPFRGFAEARNVCMRIHAERRAGGWVAFIDADEVHGPEVSHIAANLCRVPARYDFVDAYTWHFFQSFEYYTSIERRLMFYRFREDVRWEGTVHERLRGLSGKRLALPYVYGHYGHTLEPRRHAEKGRQYSSLGAPGAVLREDQLDGFDVAVYFAPEYPRLLRFAGKHPPAVGVALESLRPGLRRTHDLSERIVRAQPFAVKARNALRKLNYEMRWRGRALDPLARRIRAPAR